MSIIALQNNKKLYKFMYDKTEKKNLLNLMTGKTGLMFGGILPDEIEEHILSFLIPYKNLFQEIKDKYEYKPVMKWVQYDKIRSTHYLENNFLMEYNIRKVDMENNTDFRTCLFSQQTCYLTTCLRDIDEIGESKLTKRLLAMLKYNTQTKAFIKKHIIPYFFQFQKIKGLRGYNWVHPKTKRYYNKSEIYELIDDKNWDEFGNKNLIKLIMSY